MRHIDSKNRSSRFDCCARGDCRRLFQQYLPKADITRSVRGREGRGYEKAPGDAPGALRFKSQARASLELVAHAGAAVWTLQSGERVGRSTDRETIRKAGCRWRAAAVGAKTAF